MKRILILCALVFSLNSMANSKIVDTNEAVEQALVDFQTKSDAKVISKFNGVKAWPVSGGVKVKIYVKGESSQDFSCHRHSDNEPFECH